MKDYAITCYSPSTYTSVCLAIVSAESYGDAWQRYVRKHGPQRNEANMGVVTASAEHYAAGVARIDGAAEEAAEAERAMMERADAFGLA